MTELVVILCVFAFISGLMKVGFGFGAGIVLNPILTLFMPSAKSVGLLAPILWFSNVNGVRSHWKSINKKLFYQMLPLAVIGTLIGSLILTVVPDDIIRRGIGVLSIICGFSLWNASRKSDKKVQKRTIHPVITKLIRQVSAFLSGLIGAAANSGGIPLSVLFSQEKMSKQAFTANIIVLLAIMDTLKIIFYIGFDVIAFQDLLLAFIYIPLIILGGYVGKWLNHLLAERVFFHVIHGLIFFMGYIY
ncbi:sulfite exporter TauE/SafE family protein [Gracilibacillus salinarum]|uniref:Probable membrane transporter protein n=1 Tax=Gracilibacillus salinarum TaxID=2932255 RepID=A0ABY4GL20_9BACI|nr:sulfite exporter TauE/SafE family protein [Gracilibacillus salinarum]UOQ84870.1 sulfite exporter TauE/SafE family protein [Gracilibacillus salinarum]